MGYKTSWIGGFLVAGLVSLLALPSAAQETITVTTLEDTADPPFDADDPCGVGTIDDLPGADGEVSLREAIIAANNTQGDKVIVFHLNAQGTVIAQTVITSNTISANKFMGVEIRGGEGETAGNTVDGVIEGNTVTNNGTGEFVAGIGALGGVTFAKGERVTNNTVTVEIRDNLVQDNIGQGIGVSAGQGDASGNVVTGVMEGNTVVDNDAGEGSISGIALVGGVTFTKEAKATQNTLIMEVRSNFVQGNTDTGLGVNAGQDGAVDNTVDVTLDGNTVTNHDGFGIQFAGGVNTGQVSETTSRNTLTVQASENQMSGSGIFGMAVFGGFQGLAKGNTVLGTLSSNTVADSGDTGIAVFGGFDDSLGVIARNVVEGTIANNTADGIVCEDGIKRNSAVCVQIDNTITP